MSCGSSCPSALRFVKWFPKIAFGLVIAGYGVNHLRHLEEFRGMAGQVFSTQPVLGMVAGYLAYLVPVLMIVGGVLFAIGQVSWLSKLCILSVLSGILGWAGLAVMLGDVSSGAAMMPLIQNAAVLLIAFYAIKKLTCCKGACQASCGNSASGCGSSCTCPRGQCKCDAASQRCK